MDGCREEVEKPSCSRGKWRQRRILGDGGGGGEPASAFRTTDRLTDAQQGLQAAPRPPRCSACSPRSWLPNEFMIIPFSRGMKHSDGKIKKKKKKKRCVAPGEPDEQKLNCK